MRNSKLYRKIYLEHHGSIPENWVIHHIDYNEENNEIENLIALPKQFHSKMHDLSKKFDKILNRNEIKESLEAYLKRYEKYKKGINSHSLLI